MLDLITQSQIWRFLLEETKKRKIGMVIVSHSNDLTEQIATKVISMKKNNSEII